MSDKTFGIMKDLKVGKYVLMDDEPCRVVSIQTSAPGKHGAAKMRVEGIGIFDNGKRTLMKPSDADVEIPLIERKVAQIQTMSGNTAQLMDTADFSIFELQVPEEMQAEATPGKEVEYMETMGRKLITRVRG
jgi:translation initiation factor 5A